MNSLKNLNPFLILNVAEKPSVAKKLTELLSHNKYNKETSYSKYNPLFSFTSNHNLVLNGEKYNENNMKFTSVNGHMMSMNFVKTYPNWSELNPLDLFSDSIKKEIMPDCKNLLYNIENLSKKCGLLILWLDCDREGENIAYEIIQISQKANPNIIIKRAQFSVLENTEIKNAIENLQEPNQNLALAVDLRQELDLRIGSSLTVFQTNSLQEKNKTLKYKTISYGPCQIPTLGFVVESYKQRLNFKPKKFWYLEGLIKKESQNNIILTWKNEKSFDKSTIQNLLEKFNGKQQLDGKIIKITQQERIKYKPYPLNTVKLQKIASEYLNFSSSDTMKIAESLYNKGYISYPRTETNIFKKSTNFRKLIEIHKDNETLGSYANFLLTNKIYPPRDGKKNDNSHPPIYPSKALPLHDTNITKLEALLYELISRYFLASCSKDSFAEEKQYDIEIEGESFCFKELHIKEKNFLEIYPYDKWNETKKIEEIINEGDLIKNIEISMKEGVTTPPALLNESQLIDLMDKHGIGTDATIHEHIKKVQDREYCIKINKVFQPTAVGYSLIETYEKLGLHLHKPNLRSEMEKGFKLVADGNQDKQELLNKTIENFRLICSGLLDRKQNFQDIFSQIYVENFEKMNIFQYQKKKREI